jgi:hypothetical protein
MRRLLMLSVAAFAALAPRQAVAGDEPQQGDVAAVVSPLGAQPLEQLSATRERPLFSPTRRPPPEPAVVVQGPPPPPPPPPPPDVALYGIVMDGEQARAVIRANPADKLTRVGIGDDVGGWKVAQIEGRRLVLSLDGRLATFDMFSGKINRDVPRSDSMSQTQTTETQESKQESKAEAPAVTPKQSGRHRVRSPN